MASLRSQIGRAVQISSDDESPRSSKPKMTEIQCMAAWKRMTLALLLMLETAGKQVVMDYIAKKSMELKDNDKVQKEHYVKEKK